MNEEKMTIATLEMFIEANGGKGPWRQEQHEEALKKFPYTAIVESYLPTADFATRWCWQQFGPMDCKTCGEYCSEYPGCPLVLAIEEYVIKKSYVKDGVTYEYDFHTRDPGTHGHEGIWTAVGLGKTGYDYWFCEYYFKNEADRDKFVVNLDTFGLGENYAQE